MKKRDKYFSTAELMTLDEASLDVLEDKGTIDQGRRLAARYQLALKANNRTYQQYQKLKGAADAANTEQQTSQAELEALRAKVQLAESQLAK